MQIIVKGQKKKKKFVIVDVIAVALSWFVSVEI